VLGPFDYVDPPRTRNLWFSEGVTSYYGDLSVRRAGLATDADYLSGLAAKIRWLQATPGRKRVTADESSLRVWEANNSNGYGGLSYYLKGELIGLCLDLKLRGLTNNRSSLDGVMRDMMARFGLPKPGFPEDGIRDAVIRAGGAEMGPFYDLLCRSTEELPFAECLSYAGLLLETTGRNQFVISPAPDALPQAVAVRRSWLTGLKAQQPAESTAIFPVFCHETSCRTSYVAERTGLPAIHSVVLDSQSL
jgi:predicted metalloprotease with PDZ domain